MTDDNTLFTARQKIDSIDKDLAYLFEARMSAAAAIGKYKIENGLPVYDAEREKKIIDGNSRLLSNCDLVPYYKRFLKSCMAVSRDYQNKLADSENRLTVSTDGGSYTVYFGKGIASEIKKYFDFGVSKILIVTDSGVPSSYVESLNAALSNSSVFSFPQGENSKNMQTVCDILTVLCEKDFNRNDYIIALGGGVVGDVAGFAASVYMRGIGFINMPTTLLSQVDSSVGGKTGVDFCSVKNLAGAFYQPKAVFIDYSFLDSLPRRQISNGIAECIKIAAVLDENLFSVLEKKCFGDVRKEIIYRCIQLKRDIVEADERESGLRRVLNFGHTFGHAYEYADGYSSVLHGEAVGIGMLRLCSADAHKRISELLTKYNLPLHIECDKLKVFEALRSDKKNVSNGIMTVYVDKIGHFSFEKKTISELEKIIEECTE